jgi:hypothetical protein
MDEEKKDFIPKANPNDIVYCACGCGKQIPFLRTYKYKGWAKFLPYHNNRLSIGKTYEELYGYEKAAKMKIKPEGFGQKISISQQGKTLAERYGDEKKALRVREKLSQYASRNYEQKFGIIESERIKQLRRENIKEHNEELKQKGEIHREELRNRICICGCGEKLDSIDKDTRYIQGHQNINRECHKAFPDELKYCQCGCNGYIPWKDEYKYCGWAKFIDGHQNNVRKGKTLGEIFGEVIAEKIRTKPEGFGDIVSQNQQGKTLAERYGDEEKAKEVIEKVSISASRSYEERLGKEEAERQIQMRRLARLGKNYFDLFGEQKAMEIHQKQADRPGWGKGKNEPFIIAEIQKICPYKIINKVFNIMMDGKIKACRIDGYIEELNICIEVDEYYHMWKNQMPKDEERERLIQEKYGCEFIRIDDCLFMGEPSIYLEPLKDAFNNKEEITPSQ